MTKAGNWISPRLNKYESVIVFIFLVGLIIKTITDLEVDIITVLTLSTLAVLYFFNTYAVKDDENAGGYEKFVDKLASLSASAATIGILFRLQNWAGYETMILCGCITLLILLPVVFIFKSRKPGLKLFDRRSVFRMIVIVGI